MSADTAAAAAPVRTTVTQPETVQLGDDGGYAYSEEQPVTIPDGQRADAYPSSAFFAFDAPIADINVTLEDVVADHLDDLDVLLVGPQGQQVTLMSDAGGTDGLNGATIEFDDDASDAVPDEGSADGSPTWLPADYEPGDSYPAPAASNGNTDLSVFDGTSAAGVWSLYVVDDTTDGVGASFSQFWIHLELDTSPYPSQVEVIGLGTLTDVDVSFERFYSAFAEDTDVMLVGPRGQQVVLMSDAGGQADAFGAHLRFDDEASRPFPRRGIVAGTYRPTDYEDPAGDDFAPGPVSVGNTSLAVFDGTDPNGTWSLYAVDDYAAAYSRIEGWSLHLEWNDAAGARSVTRRGGPPSATRLRLGRSAHDPVRLAATTTRASRPGRVRSHSRPRERRRTCPRRELLLKVVATEALDPKTLNRRSVVLTRNGHRVATDLVYNPAKHKIVLRAEGPAQARQLRAEGQDQGARPRGQPVGRQGRARPATDDLAVRGLSAFGALAGP